MREVVLGLSENLHVRAEQKNVMRVPTTTIQPQNNNPLKFSASVEEALTNLLFRDSAEYLSAVDAVRETFGDIKQHQQQLLSAMRTAVVDYVGRLDPEELENKIGRGRCATRRREQAQVLGLVQGSLPGRRAVPTRASSRTSSSKSWLAPTSSRNRARALRAPGANPRSASGGGTTSQTRAGGRRDGPG